MTGAELIKWSGLHERRARTGLLAMPLVIATITGGALAGWVAWRAESSYTAASNAWLAGALVAFAIAFMRVPFHIYWRADAPLLAQLPIEGRPLFEAALWRCVRAAAVTAIAVAIGAAPLASDVTLFVRHLAITGTLAICAAFLLPAVAIWAAAIVAVSQTEGMAALRAAAGIDQLSAPRRGAARTGKAGPFDAGLQVAKKVSDGGPPPPAPSTALLGALPGFASTIVVVGILYVARWRIGETPTLAPSVGLGILATGSLLAIVAVASSAAKTMGSILRDVSSLDRQRLATLEIRPPTAIERAIAALIGDAALPYSKDVRLMRRRYPMAFALGALAFLVLGIIGIAQPDDPTPWMVATLVGVTAYGLANSARLHRLPIEHVRLSASLPISTAARERAKRAWVAGWWVIFIVAPALFASLRQPDPREGLALLGAATLVVIGGAFVRRNTVTTVKTQPDSEPAR